jgi:hypothetical protein
MKPIFLASAALLALAIPASTRAGAYTVNHP